MNMPFVAPIYFDSFGGRFNGQHGRAALFRDLLSEFKFAAMVETGTYFGSTTEYLAFLHNAPVTSFESSSLHALISTARLERFPHAAVVNADSRSGLSALSEDPSFPKENVFFYLDAHWDPALPLADEFRLILQYWSKSIVMIEDFEVPDDPGYSFDDFGAEKRLCNSFLHPLIPASLPLYYPAMASNAEGGYRRGCVVLATDEIASSRLARISALRQIAQTPEPA
jgi:hypothetical protein